MVFVCIFISILLFFLVLFPWFIFKYSSTIQSITLSNTDSLFERILIWKNTYLSIWEHPFWGVGNGNWQIIFPKYSLNGIWRCDELNFTFQRPHNDFLWILSENGIFGFIFYTIFSIGIILPALYKFLLPETTFQKSLEIGLFISFYIGLGAISMFDFPLERAEHNIWVIVIMAYLYIQVQDFYKSYFQFRVSSLWLIIVAFVAFFTVTICFKHIQGEYITQKVYNCRNANDFKCVVNLSTKSISFARTLDNVSMPMSWYKGNAEASLQNYNDAFMSFEKAYQSSPFNRFVINDLGTAYLLKENYIEAKKMYQLANFISPRYDEPILNLIGLNLIENDKKTAQYWFGKLKHTTARSEEFRKLIFE